MSRENPDRPKSVVGPLGQPITVHDLPPPDTKRWVTRRKAEVIAAIRGGLITRDEVCTRYGISDEELRSWEGLFDQHGMRGLKATLLQLCRHRSKVPQYI